MAAWKVSKYGVISGPHFLVFGLKPEIYGVFIPNTGKYEPEITPYLDTFHTVIAVAEPAENYGNEWGLTWYLRWRIYISIPTWTH